MAFSVFARLSSLVCLLVFFSFSCAPPHKSQATVQLPEAFHQAPPLEPAAVPQPAPSLAEALQPWWTSFGDLALDQAIRQALAANPGMEAAAARLRQAHALAKQSGSALWPSLDAAASARRGRSLVAGNEVTSETYGLGLSLSYEVDLWRKLDKRADAGQLDAVATLEDYRAVALALSASVARAYLAVQYQRELIATLESELDLNQKLRQVIELRFGQGRATAVEVLQQREAVAALEAQVPLARANLISAHNLLSTLLGQAPLPAPALAHEPSSAGLLAVPALPALGLPSDLLQNRPDLRAAQIRLQAADLRLAAAVADRFPSFRISGELAYSANSFSDLFDKWIWSLAGNLVGPLFDGNRRQAEVERVRAQLDESLARYREALLTAVREVEDALAQENGLKLSVEKLELQLQLAESAVQAQQSRYLQGIGDFLPLLIEMQGRERLRRNILASKRARIESRFDLCRALATAPPTVQPLAPLPETPAGLP